MLNLPVLMIAGYADEGLMSAGFAAGGNDFSRVLSNLPSL
jgi:PleD family two-component response regulator